MVNLDASGPGCRDSSHVKMCLTVGPGVSDALLEDILGFLNELTVQIDGVALNPPRCIVLAEDEVGGLLVVLLHHCAMSFALLG